MVSLSQAIKKELWEMGAALVDFADLSDLPREQTMGFKYGISIAVAIAPDIINNMAEKIIKDSGYNVLPKTRSNVTIDYMNHSTVLPHKTVATKAGLGWIGKCALLVTAQFGSAVRISSVLTDAPLEVSEPITVSGCGKCDNCVRNCPAEAMSGDLWHAGMEREVFYNYMACRRKAIERSWRVSPGETH
ncbi:MAG: hypothetical protein K0R50_4650, partial [Eubacterium sp.]|nr:hypothetical protein [Eubacterium sp.]